MVRTGLFLLAALVVFEGFAFGLSFAVTGEVQHPGRYSLSEKVGILKAISVAGGLTKSGGPAKALIIRKKQEISVNIKDILRGTTKDCFLLDGDEVHVPKRDPQLIAPGTPPQ